MITKLETRSISKRARISILIVLAMFQFVLLGGHAAAHEGHDDTGVTTTVSKIRGKITVGISDDYKNKRADVIYQLEEEGTGRIYNVHFKDRAPRTLRTGSVVNLRGRVMRPAAAGADGEILLGAGNDGTNVEVTSQATAQAISGAQNTLVMLLKFNDANVTCSKEQVESLMWSPTVTNTVDALYKDTSQGTVSFTGAVEADLVINSNIAGSCDYNAWATAATTAATNRGINLANYPRRVFVFPSGHSCGWAGLGTLGGSPSKSWIAGGYCGHVGVYAHELGHNLTMHHAATPTSEYGDNSDVMGGASTLKRMNAPHMVQMGWIPSTKVSAVGIGSHEIASLSADPVSTGLSQVLKIARPSSGDQYYLSWRSQVGFDRNLASTFLNRLSVHTYSSGMAKTYLLQTVGPGEAFVDSINGLSFKVTAAGGSAMTVQIDGECRRNPPTLSLSPASQTLGVGSQASFSVSLRNNDSPFCPNSTFALSSVAATAGYSASFPNGNTVAVAAGSTSTSSLTITNVSSTVTTGFSVTAQDQADLTRSVMASGTLNYDGIAPTAPTNLTATASKNKSIKLAWSASTDASGIAKYRIERNGAIIGETLSLSFTDAGQSGTVSYRVFAVDRAGNTSAASNTATVTLATGGGGGKPRR